MPKRNLAEWYYQLEEDYDEQYLPASIRRQKLPKWPLHPEPEVVEQQDGNESFDFTYPASRFERTWLLESLGSFYYHRWIDDVLRIVKGGKEATVYLCQGAAAVDHKLVAAKVYRPRRIRNLKNDHLYREGRQDLDADGHPVIDDGRLHAMRKKTSYGMELLHTSWIEHEVAALKLLHAAGADVPKAYESDSNAILMTYIGDETLSAPTLNTIRLERDEAQPLFERVARNIEIMLAHGKVHGDLSAYNILYWDGEITLIDFPQVISPEENRSAFRIFERDVTRVCEYFTRQGVPTRPRRLAADLWTAYHYRMIPEVHPALLDDQDEQDVAYWKSINQQS